MLLSAPIANDSAAVATRWPASALAHVVLPPESFAALLKKSESGSVSQSISPRSIMCLDFQLDRGVKSSLVTRPSTFDISKTLSWVFFFLFFYKRQRMTLHKGI
ncbi:hypothetical protein J3459_007476 [Metarhizium acridum]|uniref:uncharacterized protein n=1 Tax=Metarhizium acridum TaxID=92637 RepID=UPI001C6B4C67|nr:hypothetical protein J3458_003264 [Metarhizium acridum]KAG8427161.1 hypothetical protein J3459_007476 [Metarhizium acridum]